VIEEKNIVETEAQRKWNIYIYIYIYIKQKIRFIVKIKKIAYKPLTLDTLDVRKG
jgi:hypothetical protein